MNAGCSVRNSPDIASIVRRGLFNDFRSPTSKNYNRTGVTACDRHSLAVTVESIETGLFNAVDSCEPRTAIALYYNSIGVISRIL